MTASFNHWTAASIWTTKNKRTTVFNRKSKQPLQSSTLKINNTFQFNIKNLKQSWLQASRKEIKLHKIYNNKNFFNRAKQHAFFFICDFFFFCDMQFKHLGEGGGHRCLCPSNRQSMLSMFRWHDYTLHVRPYLVLFGFVQCVPATQLNWLQKIHNAAAISVTRSLHTGFPVSRCIDFSLLNLPVLVWHCTIICKSWSLCAHLFFTTKTLLLVWNQHHTHTHARTHAHTHARAHTQKAWGEVFQKRCPKILE